MSVGISLLCHCIHTNTYGQLVALTMSQPTRGPAQLGPSNSRLNPLNTRRLGYQGQPMVSSKALRRSAPGKNSHRPQPTNYARPGSHRPQKQHQQSGDSARPSFIHPLIFIMEQAAEARPREVHSFWVDEELLQSGTQVPRLRDLSHERVIAHCHSVLRPDVVNLYDFTKLRLICPSSSFNDHISVFPNGDRVGEFANVAYHSKQGYTTLFVERRSGRGSLAAFRAPLDEPVSHTTSTNRPDEDIMMHDGTHEDINHHIGIGRTVSGTIMAQDDVDLASFERYEEQETSDWNTLPQWAQEEEQGRLEEQHSQLNQSGTELSALSQQQTNFESSRQYDSQVAEHWDRSQFTQPTHSRMEHDSAIYAQELDQKHQDHYTIDVYGDQGFSLEAQNQAPSNWSQECVQNESANGNYHNDGGSHSGNSGYGYYDDNE